MGELGLWYSNGAERGIQSRVLCDQRSRDLFVRRQRILLQKESVVDLNAVARECPSDGEFGAMGFTIGAHRILTR